MIPTRDFRSAAADTAIAPDPAPGLEEQLAARTRELGERLKELRCLYTVSETLRYAEDGDLSAALEAVAALLPSGWRHSEVAASRVVVGADDQATPGFADCIAFQEAPIVVAGSVVGTVAVGYREPRPAAVEGPFLREERELIDSVAGMIGEAVRRWRTDVARRLAEASLRNREHRLAALFEQHPLPVLVWDAESLSILDANPAACEQYGYTREELLALSITGLRSPEQAAHLHREREQATGDPSLGTHRHRRKDGSDVFVTVHTSAVEDGAARMSVISDVTATVRAEEEQRRLEEQLRHAQKMEAIGRLAGGVAHDFNNLLTAIGGYADLLGIHLAGNPQALQDVEEIRKATDRAATLTRQLLAFGRRQVLEPRRVDLNEVAAGLEGMLRRLIGEHIELRARLRPGIGSVWADPGQLEQVIVNLAINARDAMPHGGILTIETSATTLPRRHDGVGLELEPGAYVLLAIADTGIGIDAETRRRLFEPFFTTKEQGKGTGLGLATVYGIVKQSRGCVVVESEPGAGSRFEVYLPRLVEEEVEASSSLVAGGPAEEGTGRCLLIVEDEDSVRQLLVRILAAAGYRVLAAASGEEALELAKRHAEIDALVSDVVMPDLRGPELALRLRSWRPELPVLFISGYTGDALERHGERLQGERLLAKPFAPEELLAAIAGALEG